MISEIIDAIDQSELTSPIDYSYIIDALDGKGTLFVDGGDITEFGDRSRFWINFRRRPPTKLVLDIDGDLRANCDDEEIVFTVFLPSEKKNSIVSSLVDDRFILTREDILSIKMMVEMYRL